MNGISKNNHKQQQHKIKHKIHEKYINNTGYSISRYQKNKQSGKQRYQEIIHLKRERKYIIEFISLHIIPSCMLEQTVSIIRKSYPYRPSNKRREKQNRDYSLRW
jgi:hypothetical protein